VQALITGAVAVLVGYASSVAIVWQGLQAVGASSSQAALALGALSAGQGFLSFYLSYRQRIPLLFAWSTPGAALLVASGAPDFSSAVAAFLFAAALGIGLALLKGLSWVMRVIPVSLASALLAGVLMRLTLDALGQALQEALLWPVASLWLAYVLLRRLWPSAAIFCVLALVVGWSWWLHRDGLVVESQLVHQALALPAPKAELTTQAFEWPLPRWEGSVILGLGLPLFLVTLTGQNMAGLAAIKSFGYTANPDRLLFAASLASAIAAFFGGHALNLAAITAAICLGPQAGEQPNERWKAAAWAGGLYLMLACFALWVIEALAWLHPVLVLSLASIALMSSIASALQQAFGDQTSGQGFPQTLCLLTVLSDVQIGGFGSVFWGLCIGVFARVLQKQQAKLVQPSHKQED